MTITPIYAGLLGLVFLFLSSMVIVGRTSKKVSLGDGGDETLNRRIRAHANFAEYVPLSLILIVLIEETGGEGYLVHGLNIVLLIGRLMHGIALSSATPQPFFRTGGATLSLIVLAVASLSLLLSFV